MAAIRTAKTYMQIGQGFEAFKESFPVEEIPFMLMGAIGASPTILQRYREGKSTVASFDGLLVKNILAFRLVDTREMNDQLDRMKRDRLVLKNRPAIIAVSDGDVIKAFDPSVEETYENHLDNLYTDYEFFSPMWGVRKIRNIEENDADVKAAYKMAQIHDEIRRNNHIGITDDTHDLERFAKDTRLDENSLGIDTRLLVEREEFGPFHIVETYHDAVCPLVVLRVSTRSSLLVFFHILYLYVTFA